MLRAINEVTKSVEHSLAIEVTEGLCSTKDLKIYHHSTIRDNIMFMLRDLLYINNYNKLKWKQKSEFISTIINELKEIEKISENTPPKNAFGYDQGLLYGRQMMNFEESGWNYDYDWLGIKFPDVFYDQQLGIILKDFLANRISGTKFHYLVQEKYWPQPVDKVKPDISPIQIQGLFAIKQKENTKEHTIDLEIIKILTCPITMEIMINPVMLIDGHTYEEAAIRSWLSKKRSSPVTGLDLNNDRDIDELIKPNYALKNIIELYRKRNPELFDVEIIQNFSQNFSL
jgi:hypothetical protein